MPRTTKIKLTDAVREVAHLLTEAVCDCALLMASIGDDCFVRIAEMFHRAYLFYREWREIRKPLIPEKSFPAVALEANWFDKYRAYHYVRIAQENSPK